MLRSVAGTHADIALQRPVHVRSQSARQRQLGRGADTARHLRQRAAPSAAVPGLTTDENALAQGLLPLRAASPHCH